jgi:hypothetical protein
MFKIFIAYLLIFTSVLDAYKYRLQSNKIKQAGSAKGNSRKFINFAIFNDCVKLIYGIEIHDWFIIISSVIALGYMLDMFYTIYKLYPYMRRGLKGFKKPNLFIYTLNSWLPNSVRKRL